MYSALLVFWSINKCHVHRGESDGSRWGRYIYSFLINACILSKLLNSLTVRFQTLVDYVDYRCQISRYGSQVGVIEFSTPHQTHAEFSLGDHTSHSAVDRAIDRVGYDSGMIFSVLGICCIQMDCLFLFMTWWHLTTLNIVREVSPQNIFFSVCHLWSSTPVHR